MQTVRQLHSAALWIGWARSTMLSSLYLRNYIGKSLVAIDTNSKPDYREGLEKELAALRESEMWRAGAVVRKLRPENN